MSDLFTYIKEIMPWPTLVFKREQEEKKRRRKKKVYVYLRSAIIACVNEI